MRVFDATSQPKCLDTEDFAATNFEILGGGNERQGGNGTSELDMLTFYLPLLQFSYIVRRILRETACALCEGGIGLSFTAQNVKVNFCDDQLTFRGKWLRFCQ